MRRGGLVLVLGLVAVIGLIVGALALTGRRDGGPPTVVPTCGTSLDSPCPSQTSDRDAAGQATATISSVPGPGVLAVHVSGNRLVDAAGWPDEEPGRRGHEEAAHRRQDDQGAPEPHAQGGIL